MTEIFTRINKDKYNVNFTTDNYDKYLFMQAAAHSCVDENIPEKGVFVSYEECKEQIDGTREACGFCSEFCDNKKTQLFITHPKLGHAELVPVSFCPSCGRELKGA